MNRKRPYVPPHWPKTEPFPWMEWEAVCPGCGRYHHQWHIKSGEWVQCAWCDWQGDLQFLDRD